MHKIEVTAPGKTILHGEHAVVYGKAAIAVSLDLKTCLTLVPQVKNIVQLNLTNLNFQKEWNVDAMNSIHEHNDENMDIIPPSEKYLQELTEVLIADSLPKFDNESQRIATITFLYLYISIFKKYCSSSWQPCAINVDTELSIGAGMGSSASYAVSLVTALLTTCGRIKQALSADDKELICKWAFNAEKIFHGQPSGIDNSICTYGGALLFKNGKITECLQNIPPLKILLVNTKIPRNTKVLVAGVKQKKMSHPAVISSVMDAIEAISLECWKLFQSMSTAESITGNMHLLQDLIKMNHHLLNCLGVGHPKLNVIYDTAEMYYSAAKLTGAGGGGCAFILVASDTGNVDNTTDKLKKELTDLGFEVWDAFLGSHGVQVKITKV